MMKTVLIYIIGVVACCLPLHAQMPDAETVLRQTEQAFREAGGIEMRFSVRFPENTQQGSIRVKGSRFVLTTHGMTTWFDGHTQWTYLSDNDEVNITTPTPDELQTLNPYAWLSLREQGYKAKIHPTKAGTYGVMLTATRQQSAVTCLLLLVDAQTYRPLKISLVPQGSREASVIEVTHYKAGQQWDDAVFTFNKNDYPTAEVIDLR